MRSIKAILLFAIILSLVLAPALNAADKKKKETEEKNAKLAESGSSNTQNGDVKIGGSAEGPGTDPVIFDDATLITTPVATPTIIVVFDKKDVNVWKYLTDVKMYLFRIKTDSKRYDAQLRSKMDKHLLDMGKSIASMHTYAALHERDKVETQWAKSADKAEYTLQYARLQVDEFHEDYYEIENNMKAVEKILKNNPEIIQRPDEARARYEQNKKEMFFAQKNVMKFTDLFNSYVRQFNEMAQKKEYKIDKLLREHEELHTP
ncbi:MAG TPA: hypothetical protein PLB12_08460 [Candidatus Goldiibacteriota bacterium]|nr:hypothetical protein [Candidatus Goldiibacteriota bacterium]HPN64720.1 hypothetical protein [Candidatus Goldiibacteriota bacterium]HRQ44369.1 hypothetical protein [Candidatus Goldiibacteriota bacterium]